MSLKLKNSRTCSHVSLCMAILAREVFESPLHPITYLPFYSNFFKRIHTKIYQFICHELDLNNNSSFCIDNANYRMSDGFGYINIFQGGCMLFLLWNKTLAYKKRSLCVSSYLKHDLSRSLISALFIVNLDPSIVDNKV